MPRSTARWIAATDSASSWRPHPPCEALPPIAHAPSPNTVRSKPVLPSGRVGSAASACSRKGGGGPLRPANLWLGASCETVENLERLGDDLIHVVVLVGREPTDECDVRRRIRQELVSLVELRILGTGHRVVRISLGAGALTNDGRLRVHLPGQVLELGATRVREVLARIVDDGSQLMNRVVVRLELEFE